MVFYCVHVKKQTDLSILDEVIKKIKWGESNEKAPAGANDYLAAYFRLY